jgi:serine/threonine protein kinase
MTRTLLRKLTLPYENLQTLYEGDSEVRLYRNEITDQLQVGKRLDTLGLEQAVAVREATLLRAIRHRHIVPVIDVVRVEGYQPGMQVIELIMPFYERGSLFDVMHGGERFSVQTAVDLASMTLLGLRELHEVHRVLHRDIKLPNVLLDDDGAARLGDLGIAVPLDDDGTAEPFDTPRAWTAPEAYAAGRIDVRADIYQMGLVLLELLSGPLPYADERFGRESVARRLADGHRAVTGKDLRPPPWVPPRLRAVIVKATALHPAGRYPRARAMADALRNAAVVDWRLVLDEPDRKVWEGAVPRRPGRAFQVEATQRKRDGAWKMAGRQRVTTWRRLFNDRIVPDPDGRAAERIFDEIVAIASVA